MAEEKVKVKSVAKYNGHSVKPNRIVELSVKFRYDEMVNYLQSLQMLNENVTVKVKLGDAETQNLGTFMIKNLAIDGDGEATLKIGSQLDAVDSNALNDIAAFGEIFRIQFEAEIDVPEPEKDDDGGWDE